MSLCVQYVSVQYIPVCVCACVQRVVFVCSVCVFVYFMYVYVRVMCVYVVCVYCMCMWCVCVCVDP